MMTALLGPPPAARAGGEGTGGGSDSATPGTDAQGFTVLLDELAGDAPPDPPPPPAPPPAPAAGPLTGELHDATLADAEGHEQDGETSTDPAPTGLRAQTAGPSPVASAVAHAATGAAHAGAGGAAVASAVDAARAAATPAAETEAGQGVTGHRPGAWAGLASQAPAGAGAPAETPARPGAVAATTPASPAAVQTAPATAREDAAPPALVTLAISRREVATEAAPGFTPPDEVGRARSEAVPALPASPGAPGSGAQAPTGPGPATQVAMARATNAAELAQELGARMRMAVREGGRELVVNMRPAELGHLMVRVSMVDGILTAQIAADRPEAARLLAQTLPQLGAVLSGMGYDIDGLDVSYSGNEGNPDGESYGAPAGDPATAIAEEAESTGGSEPAAWAGTAAARAAADHLDLLA